MLREHYLREHLKSFRVFGLLGRKEAGTVCSWCLAGTHITAPPHRSFHSVWMRGTSKAARAVGELSKRLKIHWCFDEKVSWLVPLSESLLSSKSQLCNIFKTAIFAYLECKKKVYKKSVCAS